MLRVCLAFVAIAVIDRTVGRLPFLGLIVVVIAQVFVYLTALFLSVMGFVKALFGERWEMPFFGPYREKIPPMKTPRRGLVLANTTQIFPEDRGTNYAVREGDEAARALLDWLP